MNSLSVTPRRVERKDTCFGDVEPNVLVDSVYGILTSRRVRRHLPLDSIGVKKSLLEKIQTNQPINLSTTWLGVKTTSQGVADEVDRATLLFLRDQFMTPIENLGARLIIRILFADTNASFLQGYNREQIDRYWHSLKVMTQSLGKNFELVSLNTHFWSDAFALNGNEGFSVMELAKRLDLENMFEQSIPKIDASLKDPRFRTLIEQAGKHSLLVKRGFLTQEEVAERYVTFRTFGLKRYHQLYPDDIYFCYAKPELHELIATIPTLYVFSFYKGTSVCPWFIGEESEAFQRLKR